MKKNDARHSFMKQKEIVRLALKFVRGYRKRTIILCGSAAIVALLATYLTALSLGVRQTIYEKILPQFPPTRIVASPQSVRFLFLKLDNQANAITPKTVEKIRRIPGVADAYPELPLTFPCCISVDFASMEFMTDTAVIGIERNQVAQCLPRSDEFRYDPSAKTIPCVLSSAFLEMYNTGIAAGAGLPKVAPEAAVGREFDLYLGMSQFLNNTPTKVKHVRCRIVGLSPTVSVVGVSVPIEYARKWMKWYTDGKAGENYSRVTIIAKDPEAVDDIVAQLKKMKLNVRTNVKLAESLTMTARVLSVALALIAASMLLVGATALSNGLAASMAEQHSQYALLRALGASPGSILAVVAWQGLLISLFGAALGSAAAVALVRLSIGFLQKGAIVRLPFAGDALFFHPTTTALGVAVLCGLLGIVSSVLPALALFRHPPARALQAK